MLLNNKWVNNEIKEKKSNDILKQMKMGTPTVWDTVNAVLREKFIAVQAHLKQQEKSQTA